MIGYSITLKFKFRSLRRSIMNRKSNLRSLRRSSRRKVERMNRVRLLSH